MQGMGVSNLVRGATFLEHAGIAAVFVFMPVIAKGVTESLLEIGIIVASFSFAQILSEIYFGRVSDRRGTRIWFIRAGFVGCAVAFALHYFAFDVSTLLLARVGAGIATGIMIPPMIAYSYESGRDKAKVASVISFHALGWLAGIAAAGIVNDEKLIFLASSGLFATGLLISLKLPDIRVGKETEPGTTRGVIARNRFLFLSLLMRHIGAASVWTILPIMLIEELGAELYQVSVVYVANSPHGKQPEIHVHGNLQLHALDIDRDRTGDCRRHRVLVRICQRDVLCNRSHRDRVRDLAEDTVIISGPIWT